jgi:outer membrane biosynthesis protein TonB
VAQQQAPSTPPAARGSNIKYILAGLLLLGGAVGLWFFLQSQREPVQVSRLPVTPPAVERANPMAQQELVVEEEKVVEPEKVPAQVKRSSRSNWGDWDCAGDLPGAKINQILADNRQQVRSCYERRLKVNNVLQGNLNLKLKVNSSGTVVATSVGGSLGDNDVFACVRNLAKQWAFPEPAGGECAVVQVPFKFTPHKE